MKPLSPPNWNRWMPSSFIVYFVEQIVSLSILYLLCFGFFRLGFKLWVHFLYGNCVRSVILIYFWADTLAYTHTCMCVCASVSCYILFIRFVFFLTECYCFIFAPFFCRKIFYVICFFSCMYVYLFTVFINRDACSFMLPPVLARCIPIKVISLKVLRAFSVISIPKTTKKNKTFPASFLFKLWWISNYRYEVSFRPFVT